MLGSSPEQTNYLLIGVVVGMLAGFLVGSAVMLQLGNQTAGILRTLWDRRPGTSRVRFELMSQ